MSKLYKLREEILSRDNNACVACGTGWKLELHHIIPVKYGGSDDPDNILTLCKKCHECSEPKVSPDEMKAIRRPETYIIHVSDDIYDELCKLGKFGEDTMDSIIVKLLRRK